MINEIYDIDDISEDKKVFTIDSDTKADWAINIIKKEQAEQERLVNIIDEEIEILKNKRERILNSTKTNFLKSLLFQYFESIAEDDKKQLKTCTKYKLPNGELVFKKPTVTYERDNDKIMNWLSSHNKFEYIKTNPSIDWSALKDAVFFNEVEGITEIQTEAKFEVK